MADWEIDTSGRSCGDCRKALAEGEEFYSALYERNETFERKDLCLQCWAGPGAEMFSFWRTAVPVRQAPLRLRVHQSDTWALFESLDPDNPNHAPIRYVLALVLLRRKQLLLDRSEDRADGEHMVVRRRGEEEPFDVQVVALSEDQIRAAQEELFKVIRME